MPGGCGSRRGERPRVDRFAGCLFSRGWLWTLGVRQEVSPRLLRMSRYMRTLRSRRFGVLCCGLGRQEVLALGGHVGDLCDAVRGPRAERPVQIDAWVVLPDHMHAVWTLPEGDADYSVRWRLIKARFSRGLPSGPSHEVRQKRGIWQRRFWERHIRNEADLGAHMR